MGVWREPPEALNALSYKVIGAAIEVHQTLGAGLLEKVYENALCVELARQGIPFRRQVPVQMMYKGIQVGKGRIDLLVDETIVVELKVVSRLVEAHVAQVLTYLRAGGYPLGLIFNFGVSRLKDGGIRRVILSAPSAS
ncbi:MAG: GxxExxY protein [Thermodesulfatator sp.]|nr:MAG: GxxExxY protein [Thermodesulfatator sp.]